MAIVLSAAQCAAAPLAFCQHGGWAGHEAALASGDALVAAEAHHEDAAGMAADRQQAPADQGGNGLANILPPGDVRLAGPPDATPALWWPGRALLPAGLAVHPPLRPPLA